MEPPALLALALGTLGVIAALSEDPELFPPQFPELGIPFNVTCAVSSGSAADFTITADNRSFPVTLSQDRRRATAVVTVNRTGNVRLCCTVGVGGVERRASRNVGIYYVPVPELNVSSQRPSAGSELRILCSLPPGATADVQVRILSGNRVLGDWGRPPLESALRPSREDAELELSCEAELQNISRKSSRRIWVLAEPRLDASGCPSQQNWTEGEAGTLTCRASGRPQPQVRCSKDGNSLPAGIPHPALRQHAGIYRCRATNELGTAERDVTVWVQHSNPIPLLPLLLGLLLPALALLALATFLFLHRRATKIGHYWLWKRQPPPPGPRPPRPPRSAAAAPDGSAVP
ncbi:PREDICTED: intercellular adhesion molecule 5-like [Pseudopodoces humilis]|uniref:intercellular adhesion molecule 5-like n=1 Tax=Pseudopodoces humilis TaxID=181119 RepID=UPI0006B7EC54|nr:PREDICTED: intercellular adhesion molecule 5-like [Pseudopodoces humilis]